MSYGSSGPNTGSHLAGVLLAAATNVELLHAPYRGSGAVYPDLMAQRIDTLLDIMASSIGQVQQGAVRALAITSLRRSDVLPDVPTVAETVPGYFFETWTGLFVRAGAPEASQRLLEAALLRAQQAPVVQERLRLSASQPIPADRVGFTAYSARMWTAGPPWCTRTPAEGRVSMSTHEPADLILSGGKVITADAQFRIAESVAIRAGRFIAVGEAAEVERHRAPHTRSIALNGRAVMPGLIDGRSAYGPRGLKSVFPSLSGCRSIPEIQARIAELREGQGAGRVDRHHADRRAAFLLRPAGIFSPRAVGPRGRSWTTRRRTTPSISAPSGATGAQPAARLPSPIRAHSSSRA